LNLGETDVEESSSSLGIGLGIFFGVVLLIILIVVLGSLIWYKMQKKMLSSVLEDAE
jgi:hypothetical protein